MCPSIDDLNGVGEVPGKMGFVVNEAGANHANKYFDRGVREGDVFYAPPEGSNAYVLNNGADKEIQAWLSLVDPVIYTPFPRKEDLFSGRTFPWSRERR